MSRSPLAAIAAIVVSLIIAAPASAATPDQIMRHLAANQTHSWVDDGIGMSAMAAKYQRGERLYITCGNVAELGRQLLSGSGYKARVVQTITRDEFDYSNDGHLMTEVFHDGRWQLYDLDGNARAVDANGQGVSVVEQVRAVRTGTARWETIASDPLYREDEPNEKLRESARQAYADIPALYRRLLGVALLPKDPYGTVNNGMWFFDSDQADRLEQYTQGGASLASPETWAALTASSPQVAPVAPPTTTNSQIAIAATPAPKITTRPCQRKWRRYQHTHTRRALVRYRRCVQNKRR